MKLILKTVFLLATGMLLIISSIATAQRKTEFGLTGGTARFYPQAQHLGPNLNNRMENGWGWSAGIFLEDHWKPKIHQIIELNYFGFKRDVFLQKNPLTPGGYGSGNEPVYGNFNNTQFNQIAISGGIKYLLNNTLFVLPAFEIGYSLNPDIDINKTTFSIKLGLGVDIREVDIILEYDYGLNYQRMVYDATVPFVSTHRNSYLQFKAQVPLFNLRK